RCAFCYGVDRWTRAGIESSSRDGGRGRPLMEPQHENRPHLPGPSLYPIGFAAGVACILVGLIVNPKIIAPIGAAIAIVFGFLWARDATAEYRREPEAIEPERGEPAAMTTPPSPAEAGGPQPAPRPRIPPRNC